VTVKESARERAIRRNADKARPRAEPEPKSPEEAVLEYLGRLPGSTIAEIETGLSNQVEPAAVALIIARLAEGTKIRRDGRGWSLQPPFRFLPQRPKPTANLAAGPHDVIMIGHLRTVVRRVDWADGVWAVEHLYTVDKGRALTQANPVITHYLPAAAPSPIGRWSGDLEPGSPGAVETLDPSDGSATSTSSTKGAESATNQREATMATATKKSAAKRTVVRRSGAKSTAAKSNAAAKPAATKETSNRRSQADIDTMVPQFLEAVKSGSTMRAIKQQFGFSDDGPIRAALYRAGYDSKGAEHGEQEGSVNSKNKTGVQKLVKLRNEEGAAWYRLAYLSGLGEAEVKKLVAENGGSVTRVRVASEKPAKSVAKETGDGETAAKKTSARKSSGKKVTRRATKADPSK
jgi:hypothetical protein